MSAQTKERVTASEIQKQVGTEMGGVSVLQNNLFCINIVLVAVLCTYYRQYISANHPSLVLDLGPITITHSLNKPHHRMAQSSCLIPV